MKRGDPRKETRRQMRRKRRENGKRDGKWVGSAALCPSPARVRPGPPGGLWPAMANGMIAWWGGRQRVTNEPPESPALVMDGPGRQAEGRARERRRGGPPTYMFPSPGAGPGTGEGTGDSVRCIYERPGQPGGGGLGQGWGCREVERQRPRDTGPQRQTGGGGGREA